MAIKNFLFFSCGGFGKFHTLFCMNVDRDKLFSCKAQQRLWLHEMPEELFTVVGNFLNCKLISN